jgi:spermidine synthase
MFPGQVTEPFLTACHERLAEAGILVVNQWASEYQGNRMAAAALSRAFDGRVLSLHVQGGNILSFAFASDLPVLARGAFFEAAQALGLHLGIPLQRHARNLWRQNAESLGVGRFGRAGRR